MFRHLFPLICLLLVSAACGSSPDVTDSQVVPGSPDSLPALFSSVDAEITRIEPELIAFRNDLHRHPELSGAEERTAAAVAAALNDAGLTVRTGVGGHGVVAVLAGGRPGPLVALRADMDAVRSNAPDPDTEIASKVPGVRHICGHDVHTTVALGVARSLAAVREEIAGSVMFVFQPAEENVRGALAMLADGVFADGVPAAIFAFHTAPHEVGHIGTKPDVLLGSRGAPEDIAAGLPGTAPGAVNDPELEGRTRPVIRAVVGQENLHVSTTVVPGFSEDFGHFQAVTPGVMYWLGVSNGEKGTRGMPHDPAYVADPGAIRVGVRVMSAILLSELERG